MSWIPIRASVASVALFMLVACGGGNDFPEGPGPAEETSPTSTSQSASTTNTGSASTGTTGPTGGEGSGAGSSTDPCGRKRPKPDDKDDGDDDCDRSATAEVRTAPGSGAPPGVVPQVVQDAQGNATAIWLGWDGIRNNLWSNRYVAGHWGTPVPLERLETDVGSAQIAMDAYGNAIVVWDQSDNGDHHIWAVRFLAGVGWENPVVISRRISEIPIIAHGPQIAMESNGNAVVTWQQYDDSIQSRVWTNTFAVGVGWGVAELLN